MKKLYNLVESASEIAVKAIRESSEEGTVGAGSSHFDDLWTRDFAYASLGMLRHGMEDEIENSLQALVSYQKSNGQFPKLVGHRLHWAKHIPFLKTLVRNSQRQSGHYRYGAMTSAPYFVPSYVLDANPLTIISAAEYASAFEQGKEFVEQHYKRLQNGINWLLENDTDGDGLIEESGICTWADSIIKRGNVLYTNILLAAALDSISNIAEILGMNSYQEKHSECSERVKKAINETLWMHNKGYYADWIEDSKVHDHFAMDGNALAIMFGVSDKEKGISIQDFVASSGITEPTPSRCIYPEIKCPQLSIWYRIGGIWDYHINKAWLWLGAADAVAKIRLGMYDGAKEEIERIAGTINEFGEVYEIYDPDGKPTRTWIYRSEPDFSWSAGMFLYAVSEYNKALIEQKP